MRFLLTTIALASALHAAPTTLTYKITEAAPYLNVPLSFDKESERHDMNLQFGDETLADFKAHLAPNGSPDFYGLVDLRHRIGQTMTLTVHGPAAKTELISLDAVPKSVDGAPLYGEALRPQLHFTSRRGWLNDPNGLIYHDGVYHMYYQHNPLGVRWGNMSWGHAVSKDLVHWEERPAVFYRTFEDGHAYSGANCIDWRNQLGLKTGDNDVMLAFFLKTRIGLCLAYSNDNGETYQDYEHNPVITHEGARIDTPRPFYHEPTERWVAPTYDFYFDEAGEKKRCVGFYSSANLKDWRLESQVRQDKWGDELCGCVDFFQLPIDGDKDQKKWVMIFIDGSYIIGEFDGKTFFTLEGKPAETKDRIESLVMDRNYYATMTWHNAPNGRRVQTTWMKGTYFKDMPFAQQMSLPSELTLHSTPDGLRLRINPIEEFDALRTTAHNYTDLTLGAETANPLAELALDVADMELTLTPGADSVITFGLQDRHLVYDAAAATLSLGKHRKNVADVPLIDGKLNLRIIIDRGSVEIYANGGRTYFATSARTAKKPGRLSVTATGAATAANITVHEMRSIWNSETAKP